MPERHSVAEHRSVAERHAASTLSHLVSFARSLRRAGVAVPVDNVVQYVRAIDAVGIDRRDRVYWAGRSVLIHRQEDVVTYDRVFDSFWLGAAPSADALPPPSPEQSVDQERDELVDAPASDDEPPRQVSLVSYSDIDQLRRKDFAACSPEELEEISRLLRETRVRATHRSRRMRRSKR